MSTCYFLNLRLFFVPQHKAMQILEWEWHLYQIVAKEVFEAGTVWALQCSTTQQAQDR